MQKIEIKNTWRLNLNDSLEATIEFENAKSMRRFINDRESIVESPKHGFICVIQMKKIKHTSIEAIIKKINLREYNLEILLGI